MFFFPAPNFSRLFTCLVKKGNPSQDSLPFVYSWNGNIQKAEVKPAYTISEAGFKWFAKPTVRGNLTLRELNTRAKEQNDIFHPIFVQPKALTTSRKKSSFRLLSGKKNGTLMFPKWPFWGWLRSLETLWRENRLCWRKTETVESAGSLSDQAPIVAPSSNQRSLEKVPNKFPFLRPTRRLKGPPLKSASKFEISRKSADPDNGEPRERWLR